MASELTSIERSNKPLRYIVGQARNAQAKKICKGMIVYKKTRAWLLKWSMCLMQMAFSITTCSILKRGLVIIYQNLRQNKTT